MRLLFVLFFNCGENSVLHSSCFLDEKYQCYKSSQWILVWIKVFWVSYTNVAFLLSALHPALFSLKSGLQNPERRKRSLYFNLWFVIAGIWTPFCDSTWYQWGTIPLDCSNAIFFQHICNILPILPSFYISASPPFSFPPQLRLVGCK